MFLAVSWRVVLERLGGFFDAFLRFAASLRQTATGSTHFNRLVFRGKRDWKLRWLSWQALQFDTECKPFLAAERALHAVELKCSKYFDLPSVFKQHRQSLVECILANSKPFFVITKCTQKLLKTSMFVPYDLAIFVVRTVLRCNTREPTVEKSRHNSIATRS